MKILSIFTLCLLLGALVACGSNNGGQAAPAPPPTTAPAPPTAAPAAPSLPEGVVEVINRDLGGSGEYRFDPAEFTFSVGQEVTFAIVAETEFHTFTVDDLDIDVEIDAGETEMFTYTFDKAGTYELICIPHQAQGMTGAITVN